jgi:hypothetical protein
MSLGALRGSGLSAMLLVKRSDMRARDAAVDATDTGCRGRELRSGGDSLGGGSLSTAVSV